MTIYSSISITFVSIIEFNRCCSKQALFSHIEKQFTKNMNWENLGSWHLDHIVPIQYFKNNYDFNDLNIQKICFHFLNLQPIWSKVNLSKQDKIDPKIAEKKISEIKKLIKLEI